MPRLDLSDDNFVRIPQLHEQSLPCENRLTALYQHTALVKLIVLRTQDEDHRHIKQTIKSSADAMSKGRTNAFSHS